MSQELQADPDAIGAMSQTVLAAAGEVRRTGALVRGIAIADTAFGNLTASTKLAVGQQRVRDTAAQAIDDAAQTLDSAADSLIGTAFAYQRTDQATADQLPMLP